MPKAKSRWGQHLEKNGCTQISVVCTELTVMRLDQIVRIRGYTKRTDVIKEAIADYLQKHEKAAATQCKDIATA